MLPGPILIALASFCWATDALVRFPSVHSMDPILIVFYEHLFGILLLAPWVFWKERDRVFALTPQAWLSCFFVGIGGSALATIFLTLSFQSLNPSVSILLQKIQPLIVILLAAIFLKEKITRSFVVLSVLAIVSAVVLSFPELNFDQILNPRNSSYLMGVRDSILAAALWAVSTIVGKNLLTLTSTSVAVFWRFTFGCLGIAFYLGISEASFGFTLLTEPKVLLSMFYLAIIPGIAAMILYYAGLKKTQASLVTLVELTFPVMAVVLNYLILKTSLHWIQIAAGAGLVTSVTLASLKVEAKVKN